MESVLVDEFGALDSATWGVTHAGYFSRTFGATLGTATLGSGALSLAPIASRGGDVIWSKAPVVTSLPAHVTMRVRFPGGGYRNAQLYVASAPITSADGSKWLGPTQPYVYAYLGTTRYGTYPKITTYGIDGQQTNEALPAAVPLPTGDWLDIEMWLYEDSVRCTFDGRSLTAACDLETALAVTGGFALTFGQFNDIDRGGVVIDEISIEQAAPAESQPPVADAGSDAEAYVGEAVAFDGSASAAVDGEIVSWWWAFGDGSTGDGAFAEHVYAHAGEYAAVLTVMDDRGVTASDERKVRVLSPLKGLARLKASVRAANLANKSGKIPRGYTLALVKKLDRASVSCGRGNLVAMKAALAAFIDQLNAAKVLKQTAEQWAAEVARIISAAEYR